MVPTLSDREFELFRDLVHAATGIALGPQKRCLVATRLGPRLRALGLPSFTAYHRHLQTADPAGEELGRLINAITTNKTDFFREPHHFTHLARRWVPEVRARLGPGARRLRIWSAGCSTGEEPYTIAMVLLEALGSALGWDLRILASDLDSDVLARAEAGLYTAEQVRGVPAALRQRFFRPEPGPRGQRLSVRPELRALITFRRINLLQDPWPIRTRFDVIFCRNVLIYFDRPTQDRVVARFLQHLGAEGLLVLGHSETLHPLPAGLRHLGQTIYQWAPGDDASPCG
jgi:chemotaxis protein methyltransferase CheR